MMSAESNSKKSVSYQKKDDIDKDLKVCFLVTRVLLRLVTVLFQTTIAASHEIWK